MSRYKRETAVRPMLIIKPLPDSCKKYEKYYVGVNQENQYVFQFPTRGLTKEFLSEIGGAPVGPYCAVLAINEETSPELFESLRKSKEISDAESDMKIFDELHTFLEDLTKKKEPYLRFLGVTNAETSYFQLMWERDFWRDKYFKEKQK